jgi:hypothetical protein
VFSNNDREMDQTRHLISMFAVPLITAQVTSSEESTATMSGVLPPDQLAKLMAVQSEPYSVSYRYDAWGRINHTSRRIFNQEDEIEADYNQHGDMASEIMRSTRLAGETDPTTPAAGLPSYSEVRYSYKYDYRENWTEKAISYRSSLDGAFQSSTVIKHTLTYY